MISRRVLMKATGSAAAGLTLTHGAAFAGEAPSATRYDGPREMPSNLTLLAMRNADGSETLGVKLGDSVLDVRQASALLASRAPLTLEQMLREGSAGEVSKLVSAAKDQPAAKAAFVPEAALTYGRLFTNPGKINCVGLNYKRHAKEINMPEPKNPILFNKYANALAPHQCVIALPPPDVAVKFDYETELLIVIGKAARNVSAADAPGFIAGYCTSNDFSARDLQLERGSQWMLGKTLDQFAPVGPYFVSSDLVGDPHKLKLETTVNGEVRQSWSTDDLIFNCYEIVAFISKHWALEPGDIIFTGTPHGVILGKPKEQQVWLKAGDVIESRIEKLGTLSFKLG